MMGPTEPVVPGVIAYNGDSERGWNDPPTLAFTRVPASKKGPKLDLRKRVSHQEALTGRKITSPSNQNPPNSFSQANQVTQALSSLVLGQQPQPSVFQPIQSGVLAAVSPCHSRHSSGSFTPPLVTDYQGVAGAPQVPSHHPAQIHPPSQLNTNIFTTHIHVPTTTGINHPLIPTTTQSATYPLDPTMSTTVKSPLKPTTAPPQISSPVTASPPSSLGKPLFSPKTLTMTPISSALDTSHVRSNPDILLESSNHTQDSTCTTTGTSLPTFPNQEIAKSSPLIFTPSPTGVDSFTPLGIDTIGKRSPVLNRAHQNGSLRLYTPPPVNGSESNSRSVSPAPPPPTANKSPISTPTGVHSACSTPRSNSPDTGFRSNECSRHNSEEFDSQETMKLTVDALEETIKKCSNILKNREVEDFKKKLGIMQQQWKDEKLSLPVKMTMKSLATALLDSDTQTAYQLHLQLMVDHVGEVKQWMVAIKRLTSAVGNLHTNVTAS